MIDNNLSPPSLNFKSDYQELYHQSVSRVQCCCCVTITSKQNSEESTLQDMKLKGTTDKVLVNRRPGRSQFLQSRLPVFSRLLLHLLNGSFLASLPIHFYIGNYSKYSNFVILSVRSSVRSSVRPFVRNFLHHSNL